MWILIAGVDLTVEDPLHILWKRSTPNPRKKREENINMVNGVLMPTLHEQIDILNVLLEELILRNISAE